MSKTKKKLTSLYNQSYLLHKAAKEEVDKLNPAIDKKTKIKSKSDILFKSKKYRDISDQIDKIEMQ